MADTRAQNRDYTAEARRLGFSCDSSLTVMRHQNADAMVLASALMRHSPPNNIQNGGRPEGGMPLMRALARTMAPAFVHNLLCVFIM